MDRVQNFGLLGWEKMTLEKLATWKPRTITVAGVQVITQKIAIQSQRPRQFATLEQACAWDKGKLEWRRNDLQTDK